MQKNTYLKSLMLLTLFAGFFLSVPIASAAKPVPISASFDGHIGLPGEPTYFLGVFKPLGKSPMARITGRMSQFTIYLPGFGDSLFTSTEDSVVNMETQVGVTHGRITASVGPVAILTAVTVGKVYPTMVGGAPAMGFSGHFTSIGSESMMHVNGEYSGYFVPDNPLMPVSGLLHMEFEFAAH